MNSTILMQRLKEAGISAPNRDALASVLEHASTICEVVARHMQASLHDHRAAELTASAETLNELAQEARP